MQNFDFSDDNNTSSVARGRGGSRGYAELLTAWAPIQMDSFLFLSNIEAGEELSVKV